MSELRELHPYTLPLRYKKIAAVATILIDYFIRVQVRT